MSTLNQAVEDALMDKAEDGSICIDIPVLIGDAEGSYGVSTTISAEQLKEFGIDDWWEE
jgi:hypothetical protein